jgi:hypothetical protein
MSRSRRKTPVTGVTTSAGDKRDKILAHRRQRHRVRTALNPRIVVSCTLATGTPYPLTD